MTDSGVRVEPPAEEGVKGIRCEFRSRRGVSRRLVFATVSAWLIFILEAAAQGSAQPAPGLDVRPTVILVVGAAGESEYGSNFVHQAQLWQQASAKADARILTIGLDSASVTNDHELLRQGLAAEPKETLSQLWLVFIGHGTFDGKDSWFNLRGPDLSGTELALWLTPFRRPMAVINTASASGPFINRLSGTNRVIVTATRSGNEQNYTRFGQYLAEALADPKADLDQDGQVSLLEAFLIASRQASEFYKLKGRLVTEHALLDDNGDGLGTPADWFRGVRPVKKAKDGAAVDGSLAQQFRLIPSPADAGLTREQLAKRAALENAILAQREKKSQMPEDEYYRDLEKLLLQLARLYASGSSTNGAP